MSNIWTVSKATEHMKRLCKELGPEYSITIIDLEQVIYRDLGNGYDIEISGVNTSSQRKKATLYLWKDRHRIIKIIREVSQDDIAACSDRLCTLVGGLADADFDEDGFLREARTAL
ncbi:MAG: hypothetical protein GXY05_10985 [Clostridiales bacterium]|nr:hypothetical protein [Clostridiales bacterium]